MRAIDPTPAPPLARLRMVRLARALLVVLVALALTSLMLVAPRGPALAPLPTATPQAA